MYKNVGNLLFSERWFVNTYEFNLAVYIFNSFELFLNCIKLYFCK